MQFISSCRMGTSGLPTWLLILSTVCGFPLKTKVPYNPAVPLLGIYLKKTKTLIWKDKCTHMFMATLWTIAKPWKQPKCSSMGEWIKNIMEYYSAIKRIWSCHLQQHEWYYYAKWKKNRQIPPCLLCLDNSFKKKKKNTKFHCMYVLQFCLFILHVCIIIVVILVQSHTEWHLICFWLGEIMTKATINIHVQVFVWT